MKKNRFINQCPNCGKEIASDSVFCEYCGTKVIQDTEAKITTEERLRSLFFPHVGISLYVANKETRPTMARECLNISVTGIVLWGMCIYLLIEFL